MIFAESQRGTGEGFRPWDRPGSTMTNGTVDTTVAGVSGQTLTVKYKDGEQKIVIAPDATIRAYVIGDKSELKPGAHIAIVRADKAADGTLSTGRVSMSAATASCRSDTQRDLGLYFRLGAKTIRRRDAHAPLHVGKILSSNACRNGGGNCCRSSNGPC